MIVIGSHKLWVGPQTEVCHTDQTFHTGNPSSQGDCHALLQYYLKQLIENRIDKKAIENLIDNFKFHPFLAVA